MEDLTRREMEIAEAMTYGGDVKGVAEMLYISPMTVESHLKNIYRKLEIQRATELVRWWMCRHYNVTLAQSYRAGDAGADDAGHRGLLQLRENYERTCGEDGMQPDDENKEGRLEVEGELI